MIKTNNSVEIQGIGNTVDFERVMNQFTSSFTESFIKVMELQIGIVVQPQIIEKVKPNSKSKTTPKGEILNNGFEKLKNPILKTKMEKCKVVEYDKSKYITIRELGIKSIYELDKRSKGFWSEYFTNGNVYLRKGMNTSKLSPKILFDRTIERMIKVGKSESKDSDLNFQQ
jgi:hypothetical protein